MDTICNCINCTTPGFGFHPNDEQLINHLKNKLLGLEPRGREIAEVADLSKWNPPELSAFLSNGTSVDHEDVDSWYFYWTPVYKKNGTSRTAKGGFWKPTGKVQPVWARRTREKIGERRTLVFYLGTCGKRSQRTPWVIYEYSFTATLPCQDDKVKKYFLCKLKLKEDGKAEISSSEGSKLIHQLPSNINGVEDLTSLVPSDSAPGKPLVEESQQGYPSDSTNNMMKNGEDCHDPAIENPEVAKKASELIRSSHPPDFGDSAAEGAIAEDLLNIDELIALLESPDDRNMGDGFVPPLPLSPAKQMPACKIPALYGFSGDNSGGNQPGNSKEGDDLCASYPANGNDSSLQDESNQLKMGSDNQDFNVPHLMGLPALVVSRKRSHGEDDVLSCVTNPETPQAKRARPFCCSKNKAEEKPCYQGFPEDEHGLHMSRGLQNKTFEYTTSEADCASMIDYEEQDFSLVLSSVMHGQGVPTKGLASSKSLNEHNRMLEHGLSLEDLSQSAPSIMDQDKLGSQMGNISLDKYPLYLNSDLDVFSCEGTAYTIDDACIPSNLLAEACEEDNNSNTRIYNPLCQWIPQSRLCNGLANSQKHYGFHHVAVLVMDPSSFDLVASGAYLLCLDMFHEKSSLNSSVCMSLYKLSIRKVVVVEYLERDCGG